MLRLLLLPILCLFFSSFAQNSELGVEWAHSFGSSRWEVVTAITPDNSGNIINIGLFSDTVDFDPGPGVWNLISNGSLNTTLHSNVQGFIQKLDTDGNLIWATKFVEGELPACCIAHRETIVHVATDNSFIILSEGNENTDFDPGPGVISFAGLNSMWVMSKFDANGAFQWARRTNLFDYIGDANTIALDDNGDVYLGGKYDALWCSNPYGTCQQEGPLLTTGNVPFVAKYDGASGQILWFHQFEVNSPGLVTDDADLIDLEIDPTTGDIVVAGWYINDFAPSADFNWAHDDWTDGETTDGEVIKNAFLIKLNDVNGSTIWAKEWWDDADEDSDQMIQDVEIDGAGNIYAAGLYVYNQQSAFFNTKIFDSSGNELSTIYEGAEEVTDRNILHVQSDGSFMINTRFDGPLEYPNTYWVDGHRALLYGTDWVQYKWVVIDGPFYIYAHHRAYTAMNSDGDVFFAGGFHAGDYDADASPYNEYTLPLTECEFTVCMDAFVQKVDGCPGGDSSEDIELCAGEDYTFPDGSTMTNIQADVTYVSSIETGEGCDGTVTTNITVNSNYAFSQDDWECAGTLFVFPDGSSQTINNDVSYNDGQISLAGCDSSLTSNVYVELPPLLTAEYDCDNDQLIIEVLEQGTVDGQPAPAWDLEIQPWGLPLWEEDFEVSTAGTYYWDDFGNVNSNQPYVLQTHNEPTGCWSETAIHAYPDCYVPVCNDNANQILQNGDFDDPINTAWVENATLLDGVTPTGFPILGSPVTYGYTAAAAHFHGVPSGSINQLIQNLIIPVSVEPTEMSWWQAMESFQCTTAGFEVFVDGVLIHQEIAEDDPFCGDGWRFRTLDLSAYADGNSHELILQFSQTGSDHFHLDQVAIYSCSVAAGCTDSIACNYDSTIFNDDGSCTYPGCDDALAVNYDSTAGCDDGSCAYISCEDFEAYLNGDPIAETSANWNTWGELTTATTAPFADDANVTNVLSYSGANGLYFEAVGAGGPEDVVLPFGAGAPYETGLFEFSAKIQVVPATGAYFNFQAESTPGSTWALDVEMQADGSLVLGDTGAGTTFLTSTYPQGQWFELELICDLTNNNWQVLLNGLSLGSFVNNANKIASLDLYPLAGHRFYIDDICWSYNLTDGCTDVTACNYDSSAIIDDGSCTYGACPGCTDSNASNFNPNATIEDGSCYYFFLDTNGVTIKCVNCQAGDTGDVNGTMYTAVDNATISGIVSGGSIPLDQVCTTLMTTTQDLFWGMSSMNEDISSWDMSNVTNTAGMFNGASSFNQPIGAWDMSNVTQPYYMFYNASAFNQNINQWDVSQAILMQYMFEGAQNFNQPLNDWDVSSVQNMQSMFAVATAFNQPLDQWDVSSATNMTYMFWSAFAFNQDISNWCVSQIPVQPDLYASGSPLLAEHYPQWGTCPTPCAGCYNVTFRLDLSAAPAEIINPEVNGFFNDWCGNCNPLTDIDGDDVWETTLQFPAGEHIWKFSSNNWQYQEYPLNQSEAPCFIWDEFGFVNRTMTITGDTVLSIFCWEKCNACGVDDVVVDAWVCPTHSYEFPDGTFAYNIQSDTTQYSFNPGGGNYIITNLYVESNPQLLTSYDCVNDELEIEILDLGTYLGDPSPAWNFSANGQNFNVTAPGTFVVTSVTPDQTWKLSLFEPSGCSPNYLVYPDCVESPCGEFASERVDNGDFDDVVNSDWGETVTFLDGPGGEFYSVISEFTGYDNSPKCAWFGGWNQGSINTIEQEIYLPLTTEPTELTWWQWYAQTCAPDDVLEISLDGNLIFSQTGDQFSGCGEWNWFEHSVDISAYTTGDNYDLAITFTCNSGFSNLFMDNVSITTCPCQPDITQQTIQVCPGDSYTFPDGTVIDNITESFVQYSYSAPPPCLVGIETTVEVGQHSSLQFYSAPVCHGDDYTYLDGTVINTVTGPVGWYMNILINEAGCDSAIVETAVYQPLIEVTVQDTICYIGSYTFPDGFYNDAIFTSMEYVSTLTSELTGCDSLVTTDLHVRPANPGPVTFNDVCSGGSFTFADGTTQDNLTEGFGYQTFDFDIHGCDSITLEFVVILPTMETLVQDTICYLDPYIFPDGTFESANFTSTVQVSQISSLVTGCDSIVTTELYVRPANPGPVTFNDICSGGSFTFADGTTQDNLTVGFGYQTFDLDIHGCDSITLEFITIIPAFEENEFVDVCEGGSYTFPDGIFISDITDPFVHTSIFDTELGCDSLIHTNIGIIPGGCMNPEYCNYDPAALCDDGSCCSCAADLDFDGFTNTSDMLILLTEFGCMAGCGVGDLNDDLVVNSSDILIFLTFFGSSCP